jgi:uncharacterized protein YgbK (DUF1537 family)
MSTIANSISAEDCFAALPPIRAAQHLRQKIRKEWLHSGHKLIVLDDDPTGVQTVHNIPVITDWGKGWIRKGLLDAENLLYILTNTRSYQAEKAEKINREIIQNLVEVTQDLGISFSLVSRGDSTLRGHYPLEMDVIQDQLAKEANWVVDGHLIIPAFFEGNRYTIQNTHFLQEGNRLVPVHQTEFAKDAVFGFSDAYLPHWVVEKGGAKETADVQAITIEDIRLGGVERVLEILLSLKDNTPVIVNAAAYEDMDVLSIALLQAVEAGKRFLYRTAASFVKSFAGIEDRAFLSAKEMVSIKAKSHGGLIIVGSHTKKTTEQLNALLNEFPIQTIEIDVEKILNTASWEAERVRICEQVENTISQGHDIVLFTSRKVVVVADKADNLSISQSVSNFLAEIVRHLAVTPQFIIAKGGITSSDIATQGLGIKKARILGQAEAGIPVWLTGPEAQIPQTPYIVFPGNVGDQLTLAKIIRNLKSF